MSSEQYVLLGHSLTNAQMADITNYNFSDVYERLRIMEENMNALTSYVNNQLKIINKDLDTAEITANRAYTGLTSLQQKVDTLSASSGNVDVARLSTLEATVAQINKDLHSVYNADLFTFNQLLDVERYVNAPPAVQDALLDAINKTVGGIGVTDQALGDYLALPPLMNAPYADPNNQQNPFIGGLLGGLGNFLGGAASGFAGVSIWLLLGLGGIILLSRRK